MVLRLDPFAGPGFASLEALAKAVDDVDLPRGLVELVRLRCSQLNGCTYCTRLHRDAAVAAGETRDVTAWRTDPAFTDRERAVLALAEAVTLVHDGRVPDAVLDAAIRAVGEVRVQQVVWVVTVVNAYNRLAISARLT
ncbi:carboxymuconolactone decarboxylase family protein [Saccharothrix sp. S26]|uniref:carboxymuconolactone decarboxylase family protein n=1 Tax=Saccharothrix sp. S26 TaxID=2907215 RepID=UPI001F27D8BB|nr:carboxymuconolactone decarboxylase family protein [Saccharothrix sp. S26]MCE6997449.1 carboxymuconolactone decarboxylase family protein [Saccharothrix sp. S26]